MKKVHEIMNRLAATGMINYIFLGFLLLFLADNIVNQFKHVPVFVAGGMVLLVAFLPYIWAGIRKNAWIYIGLVVLFLIMIINSIKDGFDVKNVSDLFFLALFVISYMAYSAARDKLKKGYAFVFIIASLLLFAGPFFERLVRGEADLKIFGHIETRYFAANSSLARGTIAENSWRTVVDVMPTMRLSEEGGIFSRFKTDEERSRKLSRRRPYNAGYYRHAHVASYFFGFAAIFLAFLAFKKKQYLWLPPALALLYLSIYTSTRAFVFALIISAFLYLMQKKYLVYFGAASVLAFLVFYFRYEVCESFFGTVFQTPCTMLIALSDNFWNESRAVLWVGWFQEVSNFNWYEFFVGKSYISGLNANIEHMRVFLWYHNDFLGIAYTYGLVGLIFYISFFIKIFRDFMRQIRDNIFIFLFCVAPILLAVFNGYYYYFTVFPLYLFFLMIKISKLDTFIKHDKSDP